MHDRNTTHIVGAVPSSSTHFKKRISKCDAKDKLCSRVDIATLQTNKRLHFTCDETKRTTATSPAVIEGDGNDDAEAKGEN